MISQIQLPQQTQLLTDNNKTVKFLLPLLTRCTPTHRPISPPPFFRKTPRPRIRFTVASSRITTGHINFTPINPESFGFPSGPQSVIRYFRHGQYCDYRMETATGIQLAYVKFRENNETNFPCFYVKLPSVGILAWTNARVNIELDLDFPHQYPRMQVDYEFHQSEYNKTHYYRWIQTTPDPNSESPPQLILVNLYDYDRPIASYCPPTGQQRNGNLEFFSLNGRRLTREHLLLFLMLLSVSLATHPVSRPLRRCASLDLINLTQPQPKTNIPNRISLPTTLSSHPATPKFRW